MNLIQFVDESGNPRVGIVENEKICLLKNYNSSYQIFIEANEKNLSMPEFAATCKSEDYVDYDKIITDKRLKVPVAHPDPYHTWITGTGLTHYGSAHSRDAMHLDGISPDKETDSSRMFKIGQENGKLLSGKPAAQPEWFYKGNGLIVVNPGNSIKSPDFGLGLGEEPELVGIYIINKKGNPKRIGFCLGNEFSDHKMEQINYLYLAHSKLRPCSYGPELLLDMFPKSVKGKSSIIRNNEIIWQKEFFTGENNMTHNLANLEYHHFKYDLFRQPGDVHIHFFGTSVLSFSDQIETKEGDEFEVQADIFGSPLINKWDK